MNSEWRILFSLIFNFFWIELIIGRLTSFEMTKLFCIFKADFCFVSQKIKCCFIIIIKTTVKPVLSGHPRGIL